MLNNSRHHGLFCEFHIDSVKPNVESIFNREMLLCSPLVIIAYKPLICCNYKHFQFEKFYLQIECLEYWTYRNFMNTFICRLIVKC